jgi:hypothetical protein
VLGESEARREAPPWLVSCAGQARTTPSLERDTCQPWAISHHPRPSSPPPARPFQVPPYLALALLTIHQSAHRALGPGRFPPASRWRSASRSSRRRNATRSTRSSPASRAATRSTDPTRRTAGRHRMATRRVSPTVPFTASGLTEGRKPARAGGRQALVRLRFVIPLSSAARRSGGAELMGRPTPNLADRLSAPVRAPSKPGHATCRSELALLAALVAADVGERLPAPGRCGRTRRASHLATAIAAGRTTSLFVSSVRRPVSFRKAPEDGP